MKTYHVQFRKTHDGRLVGVGQWRARSEANAQMLRRAGDAFVEEAPA